MSRRDRPGSLPGRPGGVTLLEILVAVAVLGVGLAAIFQIFPMGFAASNKSAAQTLAFQLAAQRLEDVRNNYLFGGVPGTATASDQWKSWGRKKAPTPDDTAYTEVNTDGNYRAFSATSLPEKNYFYKVDCLPILDPALKYREFPFDATITSGTLTQGFATMYRISVTVRGPLQSLAEASDAQWANNSNLKKGAVQVQLATYVANKALGDAVLAVDAATGDTDRLDVGGGVFWKRVRQLGGAIYNNADIIHVKGTGAGNYPYPENFTVFQAGSLSDAERLDTGPCIVVPTSPATNSRPADTLGINRYGLDNVMIFRAITGSPQGRWVAESNKIIAIYAPGETGNLSATYWQFNLLNNMYARDNDYTQRAVPQSTGGDGSSYLIESKFDDDSWSTLPNPYNNTCGWPAGAYSAGVPTGTRVRFLMKLEQTP